MIWDKTLRAFIPRNPIVLWELRYQQRHTSFRRGFIESVGVVCVGLCIAVAMLFCVVNGLNPRGRNAYVIPVQFLAWIFHAAVIARFVFAGVSACAKEKSFIGSDVLTVTPVTNWQLISGKWWVAMHRVRGWMLALGIVQLGIIVSIHFGSLMYFSWSMTCLNPCEYTIGSLSPDSWLTVKTSLFILEALIGITLLETICCITLGMTFGILMHHRFAFTGAIVLRFVPVILFSFWPNYPWGFSNDIPSRFREYTWFSFADGGTGALLQLAQVINFKRGTLGFFAISGMLLLYLALSLLAIWSWSAMQRSRH